MIPTSIELGNFGSATTSGILWFMGGIVTMVGLTVGGLRWRRRFAPDPFRDTSTPPQSGNSSPSDKKE